MSCMDDPRARLQAQRAPDLIGAASGVLEPKRLRRQRGVLS